MKREFGLNSKIGCITRYVTYVPTYSAVMTNENGLVWEIAHVQRFILGVAKRTGDAKTGAPLANTLYYS